jgi:hypothetical protein
MKKEKLIKKHLGVATPSWIVQNCLEMLNEFEVDTLNVNGNYTCDSCDNQYLPKFVSLNGTALRLIGNTYYRDGGEWWVQYRIIDGELLSWDRVDNTTILHKKPLIEITEEEWRVDNGQYTPDNI